MNEAEARNLIERHTQWNIGKGQLTTAEVDDLVTLAKVTDAYGFLPDDVGWTPTWDVREAAAIGWTWRAAKLNDQFAVKVGSGREFSRNWTPEFCLKMAAEMRSPSGGTLASIPLRGSVYAG